MTMWFFRFFRFPHSDSSLALLKTESHINVPHGRSAMNCVCHACAAPTGVAATCEKPLPCPSLKPLAPTRTATGHWRNWRLRGDETIHRQVTGRR